MKTIIRKLLHDCWLSKSKVTLCMLAAAISGWGISSVFYGFVMTQRDFAENFTATNPADFTVTIQNPTDSLLFKLKGLPGIKQMERRETLNGRIKTKQKSWMPLLVFGVDDFANVRVNKFRVLERNPAGKEFFFIEKVANDFLITGTDLLDVQVQGQSGNRLVQWQRKGLVYDPGLAPAKMEGIVYAYADISLIDKFLPKERQTFFFKAVQSKISKENSRLLSLEVKKIAEQYGAVVISIVIPPPGEHPHQAIVDGVSLLQLSFGGILALLGIILLSLILLSWLFPQIICIGIIKAVGASSSMIFSGYLIVLSLIIGTGLAIGLPMGYQTALYYARFIGSIQNFQPVTRGLPVFTHIQVISASFFIPLLTAVFPLYKVSSTSVQNALHKTFYSPHKRIFSLTQKILTGNKWKYCVNNLFRSSQRTLLLILLLTIGITLFISGYNLRYSVKKEFSDYFKASDYDIAITFKDSMQNRLPFLQKLFFVEAIAYADKKNISYQLPGKPYRQSSSIKIFSPGHAVQDALVLKGKINRNCINCFYVNQRLQDQFEDISIGAGVEFLFDSAVKKMTYAGTIKDITHASGFYLFANQPLSTYKEIDVRIKTGFPVFKATQLIDDALLENNIDVEQIYDQTTNAAGIDNHLAPTYAIIQFMGIFTIVVALFGLMIVLKLSLQERAMEMGIVKALGGTIHDISRLYRIEYFMINVISLVAGIALSYVVTSGLGYLLGILILKVPVTAFMDRKCILFTIAFLLAIQFVLVTTYGRLIIRKTSHEMLNNIF